MEKKICEVCGAENEAKYKFCNNCGSQLPEFIQPVFNNGFNDTNPQAEGNYFGGQQPQFMFTSGEKTATYEEMAAFVGKNSFKILPKMLKMQLSGSKTSWCWPVAILGMIFGPLGCALWFFYRKMYKPAVILSLIGALLMFITTALSMNTNLKNYDAIKGVFEQIGQIETIEDLENFNFDEITENPLAEAVENAVNIGFAIACGLLSLSLYKTHCVDRISALKAVENPNYRQMQISYSGGVSGGMLVLGIMVMILVNNVSTVITIIAANIK